MGSGTIKAARARLDKIAIVVGSCLLDGPDPSHADEVELQAACVAYVEAIRSGGDNDETAAYLVDAANRRASTIADTAERVAQWLEHSNKGRGVEREAWAEIFAFDIRAGAWRKEGE